MKISKLIALTISVMLLSACNNADIGIIGGADGPTSIYIDEQDTDKEIQKHSFIGTVLEETTTYMIVEPNEDEDERKSSDKIRINYGVDHVDYLYGVGRKIIINYDGFIKETYPAQITTNNIDHDGYDDFEISVKVADKKESKKILSNKELSEYNSEFDLYYFGLEEVNVKVDNKEMSLESALRNGYLTLEGIIAKANKDVSDVEEIYDKFEKHQSVPLILPRAMTYKDGGTIEYQYDHYRIIKCHTLDGNRDVYICDAETTLNDLEI